MLIINGTVVTMDSARRIIKDGAVAVEGNCIAAVGKSVDLVKQFPALERLDAQGGIIMPGLIDCHVHLSQALIRGCGDDIPLNTWLAGRVWVLQGAYTPEDACASARLAMLEMIRSGTTTFVDTLVANHYGPDGIAEALLHSGMRGVLAKAVMDTPRYADGNVAMIETMQEGKETSLRVAQEMHRKWHGRGGRVFVWLGPRSIGGASADTYREIGHLARSLGIGVTWHFAQGDGSERTHLRDGYGMSFAEFATHVELLWPRQLLAHCVWLDDADIAAIAATGTHICHLPSSNSKMGMGIAPVPQMLAAGINVCLGTDGAPSNNQHDMFHSMYLAAVIHKAKCRDPRVVPAETVLEMATINGARALGLEEQIGSLEAGKRADLIILRADTPHLTPTINPISNLIYAASGREVDTVVVDGRVLMQDRRVLTMDEAEVLRDANARSATLIARSGLDLGPRWPVI